MAGTTFDQCRRFGTDAYGLERFLRLVQASVQIILSFVLTSPLCKLLLDETRWSRLRLGMTALKGRLGLVRRFFRLFRFLDAFASSYKIFILLSPSSHDSKDTESMYLERTLDAAAAAFNGGYLLLETITIVDALGVPEIAIWGPAAENSLKIESQRCWFFALVAGTLASVIRLQRNARQRAAHLKKETETSKSDGPTEGASTKTVFGSTKTQIDQDDKVIAQLNTQRWLILRKATACCLDLALPGSVIGWVPASPGAVGILMFATSLLTGMDVWERCGREVGKY